ncbi:MAG: hypothetical protein K2X91_07260, partial [Thermoleophilia bacterium]|nr:hypothetical protein [Thermoleophilia bacterium]
MNPPSDPHAEKRALRASVRAAVAAMTPAQKAAESAIICERLLRLELFQHSRVVLLYAPLSDEPLIDPVARHALANGQTVLAPRPDWATGSMTAALIQDWSADLERDP